MSSSTASKNRKVWRRMLPTEVVKAGDWIVPEKGEALEIRARSCYIGAEVGWVLADKTIKGIYRVYELEVVK